MDANERPLTLEDIGDEILHHPAVQRMIGNMRHHGPSATEVYRLDGNTPEEHRYFDILSMRLWAEQHGTLTHTAFNWSIAEHLVRTGAVDPQRINDHTVRNDLRPIIVGRHAVRQGTDHILDGTHRYVALGAGAALIGKAGEIFPVPSYVLQPDEWRQFLIPFHVAQALRFDEQY